MKLHYTFLAGAGLLVLALFSQTRPSEDPPTQEAQRYRLALTVQDQTRLPVAQGAAVPVEAEVRLQTDLIVSTPQPDVRRIRFVRVDDATLSISNGDRKSASAVEHLEGLDVLVQLGDGVVVGVRVPQGTDLAAERFVKLVASEIVWAPPSETRRVVTQRTRLGEVESVLAWSDAQTFERSHQTVHSWAAFGGLGVDKITAQITGGARATVEEDQTLANLRVDERVVAQQRDQAPLLLANTKLDLDLLARVPSPPVDEARFGPLRSLAEHRSSDIAAQRQQKDRIAGLTSKALLTALDRTGASGQFPDHAQTLARATALLRAEPALIATLGARFRAEQTADAERTLLLDLLVGAGTPRAQAELVSILSEPLVRTHPERHVWDQRLSFVGRPTPATVAYAQEAFTDRTGVDQTAAAYALGGLSSHLTDADQAADAVAPIVERLRAASTSSERAHLVSALGNAGQLALVDQVASYANAGEAELRLAAAKALRKTDVAEARSTLVKLAADVSAVVQRRAILSLARMSTLSGAELNSLAAAVRGGAVAETSLGSMVNLMATQPCSGERNAVLSAVRARPKEGGVTLDSKTRTLEARCGASER